MPIPSLIAAVLAVLAPLAVALASMRPVPGAPVVVVTLPWESGQAAVTAAGGVALEPGVARFVARGYAPDPGFPGRLEREGAVLVLPDGLAGVLCR